MEHIKRLISVMATLILVFSAVLAVPVSASTYKERWTNVLDYATVNGQGSNSIAVASGGKFSFALPGATIIQDIDIVFRLNCAPTSIKAVRDNGLTFNLTLSSIGSGMYRAYGNCEGYSFNALSFQIEHSNGTTAAYGEVLQCRVSAQTVDFYNVGATISKMGAVSGPSSHSAGSDNTLFTFTESGAWEIAFTVSDWKKYDYIDFGFYSNDVAIGNIAAYIGDRSIDVVVESHDADPYSDDLKMTTGYLDIYGVDHDGANVLIIYVTGTNYSSSGQLGLSWLNGSIKVDSPGLLGLIWTSVKSGFSSVTTWLKDISLDIVNGFDAVVAKLDALVNGGAGGEDLSGAAGDLSEDIGSVEDFQSGVESDLAAGFDEVLDFSALSSLAPAFAFIGVYVNKIWYSLDAMQLVFLLAIGIGAFLTLAQHVPRMPVLRSQETRTHEPRYSSNVWYDPVSKTLVDGNLERGQARANRRS